MDGLSVIIVFIKLKCTVYFGILFISTRFPEAFSEFRFDQASLKVTFGLYNVHNIRILIMLIHLSQKVV